MSEHTVTVDPKARDIAMRQRTTQLGRLRAAVETSCREALKGARHADHADEATEIHQALMLVISTLDDCYQAVTDAHQKQITPDEAWRRIKSDRARFAHDDALAKAE